MSSALREDGLPQPGDTIAGHYEIESMLGHGGMGAVFAASHLRTHRAVAIKWLLPQAASSPEAVARFISEARATARIEHPNVVHIYDFGEDAGSPYLVMERLRGESLRQRLDREGRLPPEEAIRLLVPAMRGVAEAHRESVIHRDIKPDNIFLCQGKDGSPREAKVVDFGISKLYDSEGMSNLTGTGMMVGTPSYMSPEQLNAPRDADARFDVYAFGVVLYETICGRCPFAAEGIFQLVAQIMHADPMPPSALMPGLPVALDAVMLRAIHRDINTRYASMGDFIHALQGAFANGRAHQVAPGHATRTASGDFAPGALSPGAPRARHFPQTAVGAPDAPMPGPIAGHESFPDRGATAGQGVAATGPMGAPPPRLMVKTAVLTPQPDASSAGVDSSYAGASQAGVGHGSHHGAVPAAGTPHTPYSQPSPIAPASSGTSMGKLLALGVLALLLGGGAAGGAWYFYAGPGADVFQGDPVASDPIPAPTPDPTPAPTPATTDVTANDPAAPATPATAVESPDEEPVAGVDPPAPDPEPEPAAEPEPEPARAAGRRRRRRPPPVQPSQPVVRPLAPAAPRPVVSPPPRPPPQPRTQQGANGAMIIE